MYRPDLATAVATLLRDDPERILALAASLRAPNRVVESTVKGMSMGSGLPPGSRIRIDMSHHQRFEIGAVVAFVGGNQVIVHRVVHNGRDHLLTRGDAILVPDSPVKRNQVLGPVTAVIRNDCWMELGLPRKRSLRGRIFSSAVLWVTAGMLRFSPRVTATLVRSLHRMEGRLRSIALRRAKPLDGAVPPETV
jgi:hypothetical protein